MKFRRTAAISFRLLAAAAIPWHHSAPEALAQAPAQAALRSVSCADLVSFGQELNIKETVPISEAGGRITLPAQFAGLRFEQLFGRPALGWSQEDLKAATKTVGDCSNEAKKARKAPEQQALRAVWDGLGGLRSTLGAIAATEQRLDSSLKAVIEEPPSRPALAGLTILLGARDGSAAAVQQAMQNLKDHANRTTTWTPIHSRVQTLLTVLRDAPAAAWPPVFPPVEKRVAELKQWSIADVEAAIAAVPETPDGLRLLKTALQKSKSELAGALSDAELAGFDKVAAARQAQIEDKLVSGELARIDALPANVTGLNLLRMGAAAPIKAAVSPKRAAELDARVASRREAISNAVVDEQIGQLNRFPATLAGLREIDTFRSETARGIEALAGPAPAARFRDAATTRASQIGEEALPTFAKALAELPATSEGLEELGAALAEIRGPVGNLNATVHSRYLDAASARRAEISAAVEKEDARLAALPLPGGVFASPRSSARIEFRNDTRVYITISREQIVEGEYEVDGDKVILRTPGRNDVMIREGAWLRGGGLKLRRQPQ